MGHHRSRSQNQVKVIIPNCIHIQYTESVSDKVQTGKGFSIPDLDSTPEKSSSPTAKLDLPSDAGLESSPSPPRKSKSSKNTKNKATSILDLKGSIDDSEEEADDLSNVFMKDDRLDSPELKFQPGSHVKHQIDNFNQPATQFQSFENYALDDSGLLTQAGDLLREDEKRGISTKTIWDIPSTDEQSFTQIQAVSTCPMCHAPVNPEDLKAAGSMSTRAQETFCRTHKRKDAEQQWIEQGYPTIDWDNLSNRLLAYKQELEHWIKGAESHYRNQFSESLSKGQDRTLRKEGSNLVPGYYGPRGARVISEFIMEQFTKLLKQRAPKDRIMSKRGVTAYVQAVLVMEVATLLIADDMDVDVEKAQFVLRESVMAGELLCPEPREKVSRRVVDSEDEDESEDELA